MYWIANIEHDNPELIVALAQITEEQFASIFENFSFVSIMFQIEASYNIMMRNGEEFITSLSENNLIHLLFDLHYTKKEILTEANRIVFNFCASIQTCVDYMTRAMSHKKDKQEEFEKKKREVFDSVLSYRFFYKLRNYCIHYSYPYNSVQLTADSVAISCQKAHLLEFDDWGKAKYDLMNMPDEINILELIQPELEAIKVLRLSTYYYYLEDYTKAMNEIRTIRKQYNIDIPIIIHKQESGRTELLPFPIDEIQEGFHILNEQSENKFDGGDTP